jgi:hypothetical protein
MSIGIVALILADKALSVGISTAYFVNGDVGEFSELRKATVRFVMSVRMPAWNISAAIGRICAKLIFGNFSKIGRENTSFVQI